jgi:hypothetical protein
MKLTARLLAGALAAALGFGAAADPRDGVGRGPTPEKANSAFSFALIGDMPYNATQVAQFDKLIADVNADESIQFVLHTGDVKGGSERCDDALLQARFEQLQQFRRAVVLTPGDNDWTDCHRTNNGGYYPLERLQFVRKVFYPNPQQSLGQRPIPVTPQSSLRGYGKFVENVLFVRNRVVFSTVHVVGSNNNLAPWTGFDPGDSVSSPRPDRIAEFQERLDAALAWIDYTFDQAAAASAAGVLVLIQANPLFELPATDPQRAGFNAFLDKLRDRAKAFGKPVLLAHGDFHEYMIDKPYLKDSSGPVRVPYFTRVQAFGSPRIHWLEVTVDPKSPGVFSIRERIVRDNAN